MTSSSGETQRPSPDAGWLMYHSVGRFPGQADKVAAILSQAAQDWYANGDQHWHPGLAQRLQCQTLFAGLIGVPTDVVFTVENVTLAFATFLTSLPADTLRRRKVLIAGDCFPSLHFLLSGMAPQLGFELITVPLASGAHFVTDDAFIAAWDENVALAVITWVSSTASKRADLDRLVAHGRAMESLIAVDITQGAGLIPVDASEFDFAATTSLKWLCGMSGAGFGYVSPRLLDRLKPAMRGWFSQTPPLNWDLDKFAFASDARRFGHGTPSLLPYIAALPGIEWVHAQTLEQLVERNQRLCHRLFALADRCGLEIISPRDDSARGGSVMVALCDETSAEALRAGLVAENLFCDRRGVRVRWSPGPTTSEAALDHMEVALPQICGRLPSLPPARH